VIVALYHTQRHTHTFGRTPLDEGSARRRDFYLHNTQHSQEKNIYSPAGFEPAIPASERPQTCALDLCHFSGYNSLSFRDRYSLFRHHIFSWAVTEFLNNLLLSSPQAKGAVKVSSHLLVSKKRTVPFHAMRA
jgi:hypothetical protein